jgi:subtilase family serine protease
VLLVPGTQDPGKTGDQDEADLDVEWVGAVARKAKIIYVYSMNVFDAVVYAISQNLAPIISFNFGTCESDVSTASGSFIRSQAQQANAQGITWIVSSGDSGAAGCDKSFSSPKAIHELAVSIPASIPEVTAVGGTGFADQGNNWGANYWSTTNSPTNASALPYLPEIAWNDSSTVNGLAASAGGFSVRYSHPPWQIGPGVPSSVNVRAVPDIALAAAADHDGYVLVTGGQVRLVGGTSAATPVFAGMVALLNQREAGDCVGNINPNLYRLAQTQVFHDIVSGDNIVPCVMGGPDCKTGHFGYAAGPGYDPVTD